MNNTQGVAGRRVTGENHAPGRAVPVPGDFPLDWNAEQDVGIRLGRIAVQHGQFTALRHEGRAGAPDQRLIGHANVQRRFDCEGWGAHDTPQR